MGHEILERIMNKNLSKQLKEQQADKILLQAIATSADADAFLILYNRYGQRLLKYFYSAVSNADDVFDLSQNFWLNIWLNASRLIYEDKDSVENLFFNMAARRIADYYRSSKCSKEIPLDDFPNLSDNGASPSSPESNYYAEEIHKITEKVLSKYPELDKQIFIYQKELDYPAQRTASQLNISIESIYKKVSIIMKDLRFQLKLGGYYYSLLTCICFCSLS